MNQDGTIPADNPYGPNSYVYANGLRNAQGMVLLDDGRIFISEHGPATDDEFMELFPGRNYGWPNVEGFCTSPSEIQFCADSNVVEPLIAWTPTIAPSDLVFYENPTFPEWHNKFLMTVLKDRMLVAIGMNEDMTEITGEDEYIKNMYGRLRDICVGPNKEIYLATNGPFWSNNQPNTHTIVRLRPPFESSSLDEFQTFNFEVYPNPASNSFRLLLPSNFEQVQSICLLDLSSRVVSRFDSTEWQNDHDISNVPVGTYLIEVLTIDGKRATQKLVVQ
jgi:hypothetical protein